MIEGFGYRNYGHANDARGCGSPPRHTNQRFLPPPPPAAEEIRARISVIHRDGRSARQEAGEQALHRSRIGRNEEGFRPKGSNLNTEASG